MCRELPSSQRADRWRPPQLNPRGTRSNLKVSNKIGLMRLRITFFLLFLIAPSLPAAEVEWPAKLGNWTLSKAADPGKVPGVRDPIPPDVLKESGYLSGASRLYQHAAQFAQITFYWFRGSSGAYEAHNLQSALT